MRTTTHAYPSQEHERAAEAITSYFAALEEADAVLLMNSCARGKATVDSCLDVQVIVSPEAVDDMDKEWRRHAAHDDAVAALLRAGKFSDLHLDVTDGVLGFLLLILLTAGWAIVYAGFMQVIALKTRSAAATNSAGLVFFPLLFLTPNFVPRNLLTRPMEIAATVNPVTYVMEALRSLILQDFHWETIGLGYLVIVVAAAIMLALSVRIIRAYD